MIQVTEKQKIAEAFVSARRNGTAISNYPSQIPTTLDDAYAIQDCAIALDGRPISGWKVGRVGAAYVDKFPANRLAGPIFSDEIVEAVQGEAPVMPVYQFGFAAVEAELLIHLSNLPTAHVTIHSVLEFVDSVRVGIEIASSPFTGINEHGPAVTVSDFGNNKGLILGAHVHDWKERDLLSMTVSMEIEGVEVGSNNMANMLDGPFGSAAFLINNLLDRGIDVSGGLWVSAGAVSGVHEINVGQTAKAIFEGVGEINCKISAI